MGFAVRQAMVYRGSEMNGSKEDLKLQFFKDVIHDYWDVLPQEMQKDINEWYEQTEEDQKEK